MAGLKLPSFCFRTWSRHRLSFLEPTKKQTLTTPLAHRPHLRCQPLQIPRPQTADAELEPDEPELRV
jgi:hypothetical protein